MSVPLADVLIESQTKSNTHLALNLSLVVYSVTNCGTSSEKSVPFLHHQTPGLSSLAVNVDNEKREISSSGK